MSSGDAMHFGWTRVAAVQLLGKLGEHAPVEPLVAALQDKQVYVRVAAAWALGRLGEHAPIEPLVAALQDEHWRLRSSAIQALGKLGERVPVEPLMTALDDEHESVRAAAIDALQHLGKLPLSVDTRVGYVVRRFSSGTSFGTSMGSKYQPSRITEENFDPSVSVDKPHDTIPLSV